VQQLKEKQREEKLARKRAYKATWARAHYQKNRELLNARKRAYRARVTLQARPVQPKFRAFANHLSLKPTVSAYAARDLFSHNLTDESRR
jgi:hypothetical protein